MAAHMAARLPEHDGSKPSSGESSAVASKPTLKLVSTYSSDAKTKYKGRIRIWGRAGHDEPKLTTMASMARRRTPRGGLPKLKKQRNYDVEGEGLVANLWTR
jgi:hypothetical protein